jgi:hypothetical protein
MKVKRLLGSLAVAGTLTALLLSTAAPAFASTFSIAITPTTSQAIPGSFDPHAIPISVSVNTDCSLLCTTKLSVSITGPDASAQPADVSTNNSSAAMSFPWDSQPLTHHNGVYTVVATASEGGVGSGSQTARMDLKLNNTPVAPTGVSAALDSSDVVVSWNPNPEPVSDIKGYQVYRSDSGSTPISGLITSTSFRDTNAPKGQTVSYGVSALRYSPVASSGLISSAATGQSAQIPVPAPAPAAAAQTIPQNIATVDPPPTPKAVAGKASTTTAPSSVTKQALSFGTSAPTPISGPTLPTQVVQLPQPNVVQFAPLLPYSGKIPEVPVTSNVPTPVAAQGNDGGQQASIALPGGVKVTPVDAVKYVATAAFLIVAAVHITRFARKLRNAPV